MYLLSTSKLIKKDGIFTKLWKERLCILDICEKLQNQCKFLLKIEQMKSNSKKINMGGPILLTMVIIVVIYQIRLSEKQNTARDKIFNESGLFTIGRVIKFNKTRHSWNGIGPLAYVKFSYEINGNQYISNSDYSVPNENGPKPGEQFLAMYLPNQPDNGILLLDYPIKDSSDYKHYTDEFKIHPLTLDKK